MPDVRLQALAIEAFRGFNKRVELNLDGSAVLVRGPNGTGKTSLFDAIQWLVLGDISRLAELKETRGDEYLVNRFRQPGPAVVELVLRSDEAQHHLRRVGTSRASTLTWRTNGASLEGEEAELKLRSLIFGGEQASPDAVLLSTGLLQQDVMRALLEAKPAQRFAELSRLLRLGSLEGFQQAVDRAHKRAREQVNETREALTVAQRRREATAVELRDIGDELSRQPSVEEAVATLKDAASSAAEVLALREEPRGMKEANLLVAECELMQRRLNSVRIDLAELEAATVKRVDPDDEAAAAEGLRSSEQALSASREAAERAQLRFSEAERGAEAFTQLAALALPQLGDTCPVCQQPIDSAHIAQELQTRSSGSAALAEARRNFDDAQQELLEHEEQLQGAKQVLDDLRRRRAAAAQHENSLRQVREELADAFQGRFIQLVGDPSTANLDALLGHERGVARLQASAEKLSAAFSSSTRAARASELEVGLGSRTEEEMLRREAAERAGQAEMRLAGLLRATKEARVDVVHRRFEQLRPVLRDLFGRLEAHRAFTELDLEPQMYGKPGTSVMARVRDPETEVEATPSLVFSTSQANVAALCYFLGLSWTAEAGGLSFLMLDDPIQAMDDVNVLAFADLCRFLRDQRQLVISTHERRFADLLQRKLDPRAPHEETVVVEFSGWAREGPMISQETIGQPEHWREPLFLTQAA